MPDIHQPNDKLFKQGFRNPETAAGFLAAYLPGRIAAAVDWPALKLEPGTFVDSQFRGSESDLLFSAPLAGSDAAFYFLFEHQTREDPDIALRLLRYILRICETRRKENPNRPLPVIIPVVLAQSDGAWQVAPNFSALFDIPGELSDDLRPYMPDFTFRLIQLAELPFEAIRGTPAGIMVLRVMKAERSGELLSDPVWDEAMLRRLSREDFEMLLRFLMNADVDTEAVERNVSSIQNPELRNTAMSYAQKLHQEGHQEGRLLSLRENVLEALEIRFTEIPEGLREGINELAAEPKLRELHRLAIQCASLEEFAGGL